MTTDLNLYSVRVPRSAEDSGYLVVATTAQAAATRYVQSVRGEAISVDEEEMEDEGALYVDHVGRDAEGPEGIVGWDSDRIITRRMRPYEQTEIALDRIQARAMREEDDRTPLPLHRRRQRTTRGTVLLGSCSPGEHVAAGELSDAHLQSPS